MEKTIQKIPFLRIAIALAVGIVLGSHFDVPKIICLWLMFIILGLLFLINKYYSFRFNTIFGTGIHFIFIFVGIFVFQQYNTKPVFYERGEYLGTILEVPQEKQNSYKSVIQINSFRSSDSVFETKEKVIVYFEKGQNVQDLKPGNVIICNQIPQFLKNNGNPLEFDYKKYLERKKIYRQVYLSNKNWSKTNTTSTSITVKAEKIREQLLNIYRTQAIDKTELEILSALTLGYKRDMDPETKRVFSSAGAMHILAVSGLHVGIIFWMISILLGFLRKQKSGRLLFVCLTIILLWGYAVITGLSPSVMRAAAMFSIFIIGENLNRKANVYNSLAASAFFLLLFNPNNLFDLGFQLSYCAVFGIVFLQPKLNKIVSVKNKFVQFFWTLFTVSVAAQIATFPLSVYYFNQFPIYFWITNSIVIPSVMILIPAGIGLLLFSKISLIAVVLSFILNYLLKIIYFLLAFIEQLPFSVLQFSISPEQLLILTGIMFLLFIFLKNYHHFYLKLTLLFTLALTVLTFAIHFNRINKNEIIVYNDSENPAVHLIHGKKNYIISRQKIMNDDFINRAILNTNIKTGLNTPLYFIETDTLTDENIFLKNGVIYFEGKLILMGNITPNIHKNYLPDYIINPFKITNPIENTNKKTKTITNKRYFKNSDMTNQNIHFTNISGAFREKW